MNILFISPSSFEANNSIHIHNLATALCSLGHNCSILVKENSNNCYKLYSGDIPYLPVTIDELEYNEANIYKSFLPDIIHVWTPRNHVRNIFYKVKQKYKKAKLIIHLEDNEEVILESFQKYPFNYLKYLNLSVLNRILYPFLSHPIFYKEFIQEADGITGIIESLKTFVKTETPFHELFPVIPLKFIERSEEQINKLREKYKLRENQFIIVYTGDVHYANLTEVIELYDAIKYLKEKSFDIQLFRTGNSIDEFLERVKSDYLEIEVNLGFVSRTEVFDLLNIASLLIQPGKDNSFNRFRLPSKIPEFLATGRPVLIPKSNIGNLLKNHHNAIIMKEGDSKEIVDLILDYLKRPEYFEKIGQNGKKFALLNFNGEYIARKLVSFYEEILKS